MKLILLLFKNHKKIHLIRFDFMWYWEYIIIIKHKLYLSPFPRQIKIQLFKEIKIYEYSFVV